MNKKWYLLVIGAAVLVCWVYYSMQDSSLGILSQNQLAQVLSTQANVLEFTPQSNSFPSLGQIGSGAGANEPAIATWNVVPRQVVTSPMNVGVVAWHIGNTQSASVDPDGGIDRVEFSIGSSPTSHGPWDAATDMTVNNSTCTTRPEFGLPSDCVTEYWKTIDPSVIPNGVFYLHAIVYPKVGVPVRLEALPMYADKSNVLASSRTRYVNNSGNDSNLCSQSDPCRTISRAVATLGGNGEGAIIKVGPGTYEANTETAQTTNAWLTVEGEGTAQTTINAVGWPTKYLRFKNLKLTSTVPQSSIQYIRHSWFDGVHLQGPGRPYWRGGWNPSVYDGSRWHDTGWYTDTLVTDVQDAIRGAVLIRNTKADRIGSNGYSDSATVINSVVRDIDPSWYTGPAADAPHPDVFHLYSKSRQKIILYNLKAVDRIINARGIAGTEGWENSAIVGVDINTSAAETFRMSNNVRNVYIANSRINYGGFAGFNPRCWQGQCFSFTNIVVENVNFGGGCLPNGGVTTITYRGSCSYVPVQNPSQPSTPTTTPIALSTNPTSVTLTKQQGSTNPNPVTVNVIADNSTSWRTDDNMPFADAVSLSGMGYPSGTGNGAFVVRPSSGINNLPAGQYSDEIRMIVGSAIVKRIPVLLTVTSATQPTQPTTYTLSVSKSGTGQGTVTSSPGGINCGDDCSESYANNLSVSLLAQPAMGSTFAGWLGECTGTDCVLNMTAARSVTANFNLIPLNRPPVLPSIGSKTGFVGVPLSFTIRAASDPDGDPLIYNASNIPSGATFNTGTRVFSWSNPTAGSQVVTFTVSDGKGGTDSEAVTITITAPQYSLTTSATNGSITRTPNSSKYTAGTQVTLTPRPNVGYEFSMWGGDCSAYASQSVCTLVMDSNKSVTATFSVLSQQQPTAPSPRFWWPFDSRDLSGAIALDRVGNVPLTMYGGVSSSQTRTGSALVFNGADGYGQAEMSVPTGDFTWIVRFNPYRTNVFQTLIEAGDGNELNIDQQGRFNVWLNGQNIIPQAGSVSRNREHVVVLSRSGSTVYLWNNGTLLTTATHAGAITQRCSLLVAADTDGGCDTNWNGFFSGNIGDIAIYDRSFTDADVRSLANTPLSSFIGAVLRGLMFLVPF